MYCKHCLAANPAEATKCVQCGAALNDALQGVPATAPIAVGSEFELQDHAPAKPAGGPNAPAVEDEFVVLAGPAGGPIGGPGPKPGDPKKPDVPPPPMLPDNKGWAIGTIIGSVVGMPCAFCTCWCAPSFFALIFGLLALLESGKVKQFHDDMAYEESAAASARTKKFAIIGIAVYVGFLLVGFAFQLIFQGLSFFTNYQRYFNR